MDRFRTLMLREWLQHRTGWLVAIAAPTVLFLAALAFGDIQTGTADPLPAGLEPPLLVALGTIGGLTALTFAIVWLVVQLQAPGLARRDQQDRSIEFWLSLPTSAAASVGATLLVHLLLVPLVALAVGLASGLLLSLLAVTRGFGVAAWFALPWGELVLPLVALWLRLVLGFVLASLWLAPLVLGLMLAAAWLKRWGVAAAIGGVLLLGVVLDQAFGNPVVWRVLGTLFAEAASALAVADERAFAQTFRGLASADALFAAVPAWAGRDGGAALRALATPAFGAVLVAAGIGFALLVLRRRQGR